MKDIEKRCNLPVDHVPFQETLPLLLNLLWGWSMWVILRLYPGSYTVLCMVNLCAVKKEIINTLLKLPNNCSLKDAKFLQQAACLLREALLRILILSRKFAVAALRKFFLSIFFLSRSLQYPPWFRIFDEIKEKRNLTTKL